MCQVAMHRHGFHLFIREKNDPWYRRRSVTALVQDSSSLFEKKICFLIKSVGKTWYKKQAKHLTGVG